MIELSLENITGLNKCFDFVYIDKLCDIIKGTATLVAVRV